MEPITVAVFVLAATASVTYIKKYYNPEKINRTGNDKAAAVKEDADKEKAIEKILTENK